MKSGHVYLLAIMDWYTRYVVQWAVSPTLEAEFCVEALRNALLQGRCEIFNTDQGAQFTSNDWINTLKIHKISISMDGRGRYLGRVGNWRAHLYNHVSSPRSSNRTCATNASGFRSKYHAFALDTSAIVCAIL